MTEKTKQELHCHGCNKYVQFEIDVSWDGAYTIPCPDCGHEHYRMVQKGVITSQRWKNSGVRNFECVNGYLFYRSKVVQWGTIEN